MTAIFTCALALPATANPKPSARPSVIALFIADSFGKTATTDLDAISGRFAAPAHRTFRRVDPAILMDHLACPRRPKTRISKDDADRGIDQVVVQRQQGAVEQRHVDKTDRPAQD